MVDRRSPGFRLMEEAERQSNFRILFVSSLAVLVGIAAGLVAYVLFSLIALLLNLVFFQQFSLELPGLVGHTLGGWIVVVPALGGLLVGLMAKYGSPKIAGHGIPEAMEAVLTNRSRVAPRVTFLKPLSAVIAIGTGGPFGAEGPIIQTGGGIGSLAGQFFHMTAAERKVLLACGAAAGMAATFGTPIAGVIIAIELLLFEFKARSFIPLVISSTLATALHYHLLGRGPMFSVGRVDFGMPEEIPFYLILGVVSGVAAIGFSRIFYWVEDQFERLPVDRLWWPAIGGLGLGLIGLFFPRVLGVGYDTISGILNNEFPLKLLLIILIFKSLALFVSLGSGTSGGLLAPMFMASAAMGGAFALLTNQVLPGVELAAGAYALVAMAAVFGAASRATFSLMIFAFEITHDYNAILPLMLVCVIADAVALLFMRNSIMTEKLAQRGLHVPHEYEANVLQQITVDEVMDPDPPVVSERMRVTELADRIAQHDSELTKHHGLPIVNDDDELVGIITQGDVMRAVERGTEDETVLDVGSGAPVVTYPKELLHDALAKMLRHDIGRLPVVNRRHPHELLGYLSRTGILEAYLHRYDEEYVREPGWVRHLAARKRLAQRKLRS